MASNRKSCIARENRIMREMMQCQNSEAILFTRDIEDVGVWHIRLPRKGGGLPEGLVQDMENVNSSGMDFVIEFPEEYPFKPPTIRVAAPRLRKGTGFVINGSLCMELLTVGGWSPALSMEGVMQSVCGVLSEGNARLDLVAASTPASVEAAVQLVPDLLEGGAEGEADAGVNPAVAAPAEGEAAVLDANLQASRKRVRPELTPQERKERCVKGYSAAEADHAWKHIVTFHDKHGWTKKPRSS
jgi:ubiquitin-protein ligase